MRADFGVVLDACVMIPMPLADTLFRMTEQPIPITRKISRPAALSAFGIVCKGPSTFLRDLYELELSIATRKMVEQAGCIGLTLEDLMIKLRSAAPGFVEFFVKNSVLNFLELTASN